MSRSPILPGATIGILGGGQLGRMIALAAREMGYRIVTLDPTPDGPCGQVADRQFVAAYDDLDAATELAAVADVVTYEFENVDAGVAVHLVDRAWVPQGSALLATTQHRAREKRALEAAGVRVAPWAEIRTRADLHDAIARIGTPCVLKTATGGYDGKGQWVLGVEHRGDAPRTSGERAQEHTEIEQARAKERSATVHAHGASGIADAAYDALGGEARDMVLEAYVPFVRELSVVVARGVTGETVAFPPAENVHVDNVLRRSIVPARIGTATAAEAVRIATRVATSIDAFGVLGVELFETADGELWVNEVAPRPHNSGHWTQDACATSQFEQHVRAICGLPLGSTRILSPVVMENVLGEHVEPLLAWLGAPDAAAGPGGSVTPKVHLYGKHQARAGRKMGHVNVLAARVEDALAWLEETPVWR